MEVDSKVVNETLILTANGRVDSSNAREFGDLCEAARTLPHSSIVIDCENLDYISSAGLRVLIMMRKKENDIHIINANSTVYDVLEMTGITEMIDVKKALRTLDISDCEIIGEGAKAITYRYQGDSIVKAFKSVPDINMIERERRLARQALIWGLPTAISFDVVKIGESIGAVYELIDAKSMSNYLQENPENIDEYVEIFTDLLKDVHSVVVKDYNLPNVKEKIGVWISDCTDYFDAGIIEKLNNMLTECEDTGTLLHFDYHTNNILMQGNEAVLIDMDTLCSGNKVFELANIYIAYVLFGITNNNMVAQFFGFPYELAVDFWNRFIRNYLGTEDEDAFENAMNQIELLSNIRQFRHYARRNMTDSDSVVSMEYSKKRILDLIDKVSSFGL